MRTWIAIMLAGLLVQAGRAELDYGDYTSATLTSKAWDASGSQRHDEALAYIAKCLELYEGQARAMQAGLADFAPTTPPEAASKHWALNDVGTCLFIRGEIELKRGNKTAAKATFQKLADEFGFAQCWDTNGWFWKPAEAARKKILELEFESP